MTAIASALGPVFLLGMPGGWEWLIVLFIVLILFGRRLPTVARSLGQGISSFKKGLNEPVDDSGSNSGGSEKPAAEQPPKSDSDAKSKETTGA
jgi:sec-independent protein translocase protein TatA